MADAAWDAYDEMLKSDIADMANAAGSPMAGAVVAAMFLERFVPKDTPWAHSIPMHGATKDNRAGPRAAKRLA